MGGIVCLCGYSRTKNDQPAPGRVLELAGECAAGGAESEVGDVVDDGGGRRGCPLRIWGERDALAPSSQGSGGDACRRRRRQDGRTTTAIEADGLDGAVVGLGGGGRGGGGERMVKTITSRRRPPARGGRRTSPASSAARHHPPTGGGVAWFAVREEGGGPTTDDYNLKRYRPWWPMPCPLSPEGNC
ncbi:hypothetical protein ACHAW5_006568 [Stephanodiscus triporus]|uniref:Uncharacterized protein n=1 Tax=Stephanodiscus triporus TaxID=2934178 RepID=A0ABD3MGC9_9STRA